MPAFNYPSSQMAALLFLPPLDQWIFSKVLMTFCLLVIIHFGSVDERIMAVIAYVNPVNYFFSCFYYCFHTAFFPKSTLCLLPFQFVKSCLSRCCPYP